MKPAPVANKMLVVHRTVNKKNKIKIKKIKLKRKIKKIKLENKNKNVRRPSDRVKLLPSKSLQLFRDSTAQKISADKGGQIPVHTAGQTQ